MNLIPQFPLKLVVFPGEHLNLHIFEERYQELISDCIEQNLVFGIPTIQKDKALRLGTTVKVIKTVHQYPDGRMDITTEGLKSYSLLSFKEQMDGKLYAGGELDYHPYSENPDISLNQEIIQLIQELYAGMKLDKSINEDPFSFKLHEVVHKIGLTTNQELFLLEFSSEIERQQFIIDHLKHLIPIVRNLDLMKRKIRMNGHFKNVGI